jgi:uncharacterized membrane protein
VPDPTLRDAYLERLDEALPLPDAERAATVEEIAAHVGMAADALVERGVPAEIAERQVLERLGPPERLADDIAASHRQPGHVLAAAGTALRVSLVTTFQAFVLAWAAVFVLALLFGLAVAGIRRLAGAAFLQMDWSPWLDGLLPALVGGLIAFAVGRAVVAPVARAARRQPAQVRLPLLLIGLCVTTIIGLTAVEARWTLWTAALMTTLPAWFALGVTRPGVAPAWPAAPRWSLALVAMLLIISTSMVVLVGGMSWSTRDGITSRAYDPNDEYASVGPFVSLEHPPIAFSGDGSSSTGPRQGPGPLLIERTGTIGPGFAQEWTGVRLEVWSGPASDVNGSVLDPAATEPLATAPMIIDGRRISGQVRLEPRPDRELYYVGVTGLDAAGERWQLSWPGIEHWQWRGTPLERFFAAWR